MFSGIGTIFMLHRIAPYDNECIVYNENLKISPDELEMIIGELKDDKIIFLSLRDLVQIIGQRKRPDKRFVVFTLDDGYKDNLEFGYPIFKKHNIPFCIYVTNSFPNQTTNLWWYALENLILRNKILRNRNGRAINNGDPRSKRKNFLSLRESVLSEHFKEPLAYFKQWGDLDFDLPLERAKMCLTWGEISRLSEDPLVTIGAHTMNHYPLSRLNPQEVEDEIRESRNELGSKLGLGIKDFAFPFGSRREASRREYNIARSLDFDSVVTTVHGHTYLNDDLHRLDRIFLFPLKNNSSSLNKVMYWNVKSFVSGFGKIVDWKK